MEIPVQPSLIMAHFTTRSRLIAGKFLRHGPAPIGQAEINSFQHAADCSLLGAPPPALAERPAQEPICIAAMRQNIDDRD
jgi:hypothetical protein